MGRIQFRMNFLRELSEAYAAASAHSALPHVAKQLERSFVGLEIPQQILQSAKDSGYTSIGQDVDEAASAFFSFTTTLPCELANRQTRQNQERGQDNCKVGAERVMLIPYKDRVMCEGGNYFNYNEVSHEEYSQQTAKHATTKKLDSDFFRPGSHDPILPLKGAASCNQKADFYTTTPYNAAEVYAHAQYWRLCVRSPDAWEKGGSSWLCGLMFCGQLVTSKVSKTSCVIVNNVNNIANLGIKVFARKFQGQD